MQYTIRSYRPAVLPRVISNSCHPAILQLLY